MRRLFVLLVVVLSLAGCGRQADGSFDEGAAGAGDALPGIAEGEPAPGTDSHEPASGRPVDDPDRPVSSDGSAVPPGSAGSGQTGDGTNSGSTSGSTGSGTPEPQTVTATADEGDPTPEPDGDYTEPRPGQADAGPRQWESAEVQPDDRTIVVTWWSGVEPCTVLDRVEVVEEADRIVITLYEGHEPGHDGACMAVAVEKRTKVTVSQPVAGRDIVDGATMNARQ